MHSREARQVRRACAGALLLALGVFGARFSLRAAMAAHLYYQVKFGAARENVDEVLALAAQAHRLYADNDLLCVWAGEQAWHHRAEGDAVTRRRRLDAAAGWCEAGLALNPYSSALNLLKTRLLQRESPARAAAYWQRYVAWNFWEPYNHAVLAELYAEAGDFGRAAESLRWVEGSPHYDWAAGCLREAWRRERQPPRLP